MRDLDVDLPMWFTEIGAPQNDAGVPQMRSGDNPVRGQGRDENAAYVVKTHVISLAKGIEKIFWYNYIDRDPSEPVTWTLTRRNKRRGLKRLAGGVFVASDSPREEFELIPG